MDADDDWTRSRAPTSVCAPSAGPVLLAVMLCTALVAIDATILATAVPAIVSDLGGFSQFPWLFSVYLLAQAVSCRVYGKLADLFGRKPVMLFGIGLFLLGSVLCGVAWSMPALIASRAVQGLGAGAVQPMTITIARRHLLGRGAGQGAGLRGQRLGHLGGGRPDPRRRVLRVPVLALDLLRQHPAGRRSPPGCCCAVPRAGRAARAPDRLRRRRPADRRLLAADPRRCSRAASAWAWTSPTEHRRRRRRGSRCSSASCWSSAARPSRCCRCGCSPAGCWSAATLVSFGRRCAADRPDVVRPDLRPGRARHRPAGRRVRAGRADHRLADLGVAVGPALHADRLPRHRADRQRRRAWPAAPCCCLLGTGSSVWQVGGLLLRHRPRASGWSRAPP